MTKLCYLVHLVVSGNVLVQGSQHYHGNHARQEEDDDQRVHDAGQNTHHSVIASAVSMEECVCWIG